LSYKVVVLPPKAEKTGVVLSVGERMGAGEQVGESQMPDSEVDDDSMDASPTTWITGAARLLGPGDPEDTIETVCKECIEALKKIERGG
jgi:hypothetical protein